MKFQHRLYEDVKMQETPDTLNNFIMVTQRHVRQRHEVFAEGLLVLTGPVYVFCFGGV